jgi:uncharacterized protein (TIGR03435 family)
VHQRWDTPGITCVGLAELLDKVAPLSVPISIMTGWNGRYHLSLEVALTELAPPAEMEAGVVRAFNDGPRKLGLGLERRRGEITTLIVDHVEKTPAAN